jgi:hypothetical protein
MASSKILNNPFVLTKNIELEGFNSTIFGPSKLSVIEEVLDLLQYKFLELAHLMYRPFLYKLLVFLTIFFNKNML